MHFLGKQMDGVGYGSATLLQRIGFDRAKHLFHNGIDISLMRCAGAHFGLQVYAVGEERKTEGVALAHKEFHQQGSCIDRKGQFVGIVEIAMPFGREIHRGRLVDQHLAPEVGFFFKTFDKKLVGTSVKFPIDVARRLASVVEPMLGKFDRKSMKGTFVESRYESFDDLFCKEIQRLIFL